MTGAVGRHVSADVAHVAGPPDATGAAGDAMTIRVPALLHDVEHAPCRRIADGDAVKLAVLRAPDTLSDVSVCFEVWEPGGSQPPNSHAESVEMFWFLHGSGLAVSDGVEFPVTAGQLLVLPPGTVHRIVNTGEGRLYAITTMMPDAGFAGLIMAGVRDALDDDDLAVARQLAPPRA